MVARLVMELVAAGAAVTTEDGRLLCRLPTGTTLPSELAGRVRRQKEEVVRALEVAALAETVRYLKTITPAERRAWEDALAHDCAAYSLLQAERS